MLQSRVVTEHYLKEYNIFIAAQTDTY